jgi:hypothetical protein
MKAMNGACALYKISHHMRSQYDALMQSNNHWYISGMGVMAYRHVIGENVELNA